LCVSRGRGHAVLDRSGPGEWVACDVAVGFPDWREPVKRLPDLEPAATGRRRELDDATRGQIGVRARLRGERDPRNLRGRIRPGGRLQAGRAPRHAHAQVLQLRLLRGRIRSRVLPPCVRPAGCSAGVCRAAPRVGRPRHGSHGCPRPSPQRPDPLRTSPDAAFQRASRVRTASSAFEGRERVPGVCDNGHGSKNCMHVAEPDGYGGFYDTCQCPDQPASGFWCVIGFQPLDPDDPGGEGQPHCIPKGTCSQCEFENDIPSPDPEVNLCDCYCSG
jgi:hypothetical protein